MIQFKNIFFINFIYCNFIIFFGLFFNTLKTKIKKMTTTVKRVGHI